MSLDQQEFEMTESGIEHAIEDASFEEYRSRSLDDEDAADYPMAESFVAAAHFRRCGAGRDIQRIVIHITDGQPNYQNTVSYFQNPTRRGEPISVSAHYVVGQGGEVVQMVRDSDIAFHACRANDTSIGIEHCARSAGEHGPSDPGFPITEQQYLGSAYLVKWLCEKHGIPRERSHIVGHAEADPTTTHRDCPTGRWDWDHFMQILGALR